MSRARAIVSRIFAFIRRPRFDSRLDEEIQMHLDLLIAEGMERGMTSEEARAAAHRELGAIQQLKEIHRERRSLPVIDSILQDLRYAFRTSRPSRLRR
jgi:macrolide transport system ATP-binding/permease protein